MNPFMQNLALELKIQYFFSDDSSIPPYPQVWNWFQTKSLKNAPSYKC